VHSIASGPFPALNRLSAEAAYDIMTSAMEPLSIDSVVVDHAREMSPSPPRTPPSEAIMIERPLKLKGRQRLLNGLQRMGSSTSLAGLSRTRSHSLRSNQKASMSCVSLASPGSPYNNTFGSSFGSELSNGYSTAPTSVANSPPGSPFWDERTRIRMRTPDIPSTAPLPSARPLSRSGIEADSDYFSRPVKKAVQKRPNFSFWGEMPTEIRMQILRYLEPKQIVRCSRVSKSWHRMCFDGQLWGDLDTSAFYRDITANALVNIITSAGPFVKDLNLRGCVQLKEQWNKNGFIESCRNLENFSLEGCRIDRTSIHCFLLQNSRLVHVNLSGLASATNAAMKIIASNCPRVEVLNISWCNNIDNRGLKKVVEGCPKLRDLRAGEVRGWDDVELMMELFKRNTLERLVLMNCDSLSDESLAALVEGVGEEVDVLTDRPIVPPRILKHLDLTRCRSITDTGLKTLVDNVPFLEGLQVSKCGGLTDDSLNALLPTMPVLTHLDIEELDGLTNEVLKTLAESPCAPHLRHLCISYCESLGDAGMIPALKACSKLNSLEMDNTRISDLVLTEAAASVRSRNRLGRGLTASERPEIGLRIVAYDCANVTWTGIREVLSRNAEITRPTQNSTSKVATYPREIIQLKCFYNWQPTVEEHTKRVLKGDFSAAARLERKWADWMMMNEEAGVGGAGARRRRRRAREAQMMHADEEEGGAGVTGGVGRRRRARSGPGGCTVM
jgi:F-box/leucine-rich repeat protein 2/20